MHLQSAYGSRKYRLRNKTRFGFVLFAATILLAGLAYMIASILNTSAHAMNQAEKPTAIKMTNSSQTNPPSAPAAFGTANPVSHLSNDMHMADDSPSGDWRLVLVNTSHHLPDGFHVETGTLQNGLQFGARAIDDLNKMIRDGTSQGLSFVICSAYRSIEKQQNLFDEQVAVEEGKGLTHEEAVETTKTKVALPGTSEHNLGLAADIVASNYQKLDKGYTNTPECQWLMDNCWKYGFIQRYPQNKSGITKIIFEPWHYRYVGVKAATEISQKGICLEEYLHQEN